KIELQYLEVDLHELLDIGPREIDQMGLAAIRTAALFPHDDKALAGFRRAVEIVGKLEEAVKEPRLAVDPVVSEDRLGARGPHQSCCSERGRPGHQLATRNHWFSLNRSASPRQRGIR